MVNGRREGKKITKFFIILISYIFKIIGKGITIWDDGVE